MLTLDEQNREENKKDRRSGPFCFPTLVYCGGVEGFVVVLLFEFFRCFFLLDVPVVDDDWLPFGLVALCADEPF